MKLLYLIAMYGAEYLAGTTHTEIGHEFRKRGHAFSVFALAAASEMRGRASDVLEENIPVHRAVSAGRTLADLTNRMTQPLFKYNRFVTGLIHYTRYLARHRNEFDLVLAEGAYPFGAIAALANVVVPIPFGVTVAGGDFIASDEAQYGYGRFALARTLTRFAFRRARMIRATTPLVREHILRLGGDANKIGIVPVSLAAYSYLNANQDADVFRKNSREQLDARYECADAPLLVCAGRLLPIKGFDDAVRALAQIRRDFVNARLLFIGPDRATSDGSYQKQLEALATELGVRDALIFVGEIPHAQMKTFLAAADLFLVPSVLEGMNRTAIEAGAVGTPAIVTRTAGIAEAMLNANAGLMVEPRAPDELAQAASLLLRDQKRQRAMGRAGITFANRFRSECVGGELVALCERAFKHAN